MIVEDALEALKKRIITCGACVLRESCTAPVLGCGSIGAKYMIIGEAPGREEDHVGFPFVGKSGQRLDKLLEVGHIDIADCYLTNVCRCRPPKNRTPKKKEIGACNGFLMEEIRVVNPTYIITLGAVPLSLFSSYGISQMHGTMFEVEV